MEKKNLIIVFAMYNFEKHLISYIVLRIFWETHKFIIFRIPPRFQKKTHGISGHFNEKFLIFRKISGKI